MNSELTTLVTANELEGKIELVPPAPCLPPSTPHPLDNYARYRWRSLYSSGAAGSRTHNTGLHLRRLHHQFMCNRIMATCHAWSAFTTAKAPHLQSAVSSSQMSSHY